MYNFIYIINSQDVNKIYLDGVTKTFSVIGDMLLRAKDRPMNLVINIHTFQMYTFKVLKHIIELVEYTKPKDPLLQMLDDSDTISRVGTHLKNRELIANAVDTIDDYFKNIPNVEINRSLTKLKDARIYSSMYKDLKGEVYNLIEVTKYSNKDRPRNLIVLEEKKNEQKK